jgi:hypothetical protein
MTFDEKRKLLHWLFDGQIPNGNPHGIYITKCDSDINSEIDYFKISGLAEISTIKGNEFDYFNPTWFDVDNKKIH